MLEKIEEYVLVMRLRSILLMEADLNMTNKIIYGNCMLQVSRDHQLIQEEIYSKQNQLADDGTLVKV